MAAEPSLKASDKQAISKKLIPALKKKYGSAIPKLQFPVLEMMLFAVCLENNNVDDAQELFDRLKSSFCDLNEMRVSSITELVEVIGDKDPDAEYRALRIRSILQYVFETTFSYDMEQFTRKTQDQAQKFLKKIPHLSHFVNQYTLLEVLGAHVVPADDRINELAVWFGYSGVDSSEDKSSDSLKSSVRKSDAPLFFYLLRSASCDEKIMKKIEKEIAAADGENFDLMDAPSRFADLLAGKTTRKKVASKTKKTTTKPKAVSKKKTVKKAVPKQKPTKKASRKKTTASVKKKVAKAKKKTTSRKKTKKK